MNDSLKFPLLNFIWNELVLTPKQRKQIAGYLGKDEDTGEECMPEPHRIRRGNSGGKYTLRNIKWVSPERHREYHEKERMGRK